MNVKLSVVIPAYNEEQNLEMAINNALKAVNTSENDYEIIILNAFSSDKTGEIADRLALKNRKIKVIDRKKWYGLGANYMEGVKHSSM